MTLSGNQIVLRYVTFDVETGHLIAGGGGGICDKNKQRGLIAWDLSSGDIVWQHLEKSKDLLGDLEPRPGGQELCCRNNKIEFRSTRGALLRSFQADFQCGPVVFSPDGKRFVAPAEKILKVRDCESGETVASVEIGKTYDSAQAAAFIPGTQHVLTGVRQINAKGQISGKLVVVDSQAEKILNSTQVEFEPRQILVDPEARWAVIAGERRSRGWIVFWDLAKGKVLAEQGAHTRSIDGLALSPDGVQVASTGEDHELRVWDMATGKTLHKLDAHTAEGVSGASLAWSPDGRYIALAFGEEPPLSGVVVYQRTSEGWQLLHDTRDKADSTQVRHTQYLTEITMDTTGNDSLLVNRWPAKCPRCTFPELDFVPQPYLLSRGISGPGELACASLGNLLVRERVQQILEVAAPGQCRFFPTVDAKTGQATEWRLAVPETKVETATLPANYKRCPVCGEPKSVSHLPELQFTPPAVEVFKSMQWTSGNIAEDYERLRKLLKLPKQIPTGQWTRMDLGREVWFSIRLLFLMKELKVAGVDFRSHLPNVKPTPEEIEWVKGKAAAMDGKQAGKPSRIAVPADTDVWLRQWLAEHTAKKPLADLDAVSAWERKHKLKLPKAYAEFVTKVGRKTFANIQGNEGHNLRIVGPKQLDAREYRRDEPDPGDEYEPDGVLFAIANNGDGMCFDVRTGDGNYPIYFFDHETESFEPFAADFAQAVQRLAAQQ